MSDDEPELRDGPPWVMEDMILAESDLPGQIADTAAVRALAEAVAGAAAAGEPIVICGCGTSEHAARGIAAILAERMPGAQVAAADAFEVRLDPPDRGLLIAISHGGGTQATRDAVAGAASRGARALFLTARPLVGTAGVESITTPLYDLSWCHTVAYVSALLVAGLGAGLAKERADALIGAEVAARAARSAGAAALTGAERLLVIGSGVDEITAAELALKIEEAVHLPCTPLGTEKVLHGHLPAADARTGAVLLRFDPRHEATRDQRIGDVAAALAVLDMPTATLATPGLAGAAEALLAGALALQLLTLELAMARGTNPDLIRREDPLYRRVAEVGRAG